MERLPLNSSLGHVVDLFFLNYTTAFHLSWQDTADIQLVTGGPRRQCLKGQQLQTTPATESRTEPETNYASVLRRPTYISIHSDPKELLHYQTYPVHLFAVKHSNFHRCAPMPCNSLAICNLVDGNTTVT